VVEGNIAACIRIIGVIIYFIVIVIVIGIKAAILSAPPALALLAEGVNDLVKYYSSTATLELERDGINIECRSDDCSKGRIIIRVKNVGNDNAERVYAHLTVGIHRRNRFSWEWGSEERELGDFVVNTNLCKDAIIRERNPRIDKEHLPWIVGNDKFRNKISIVKGDYARLFILEYERVPDYYVIKVPSSDGKPMICLQLDLITKYLFHITINGRRVRRPLVIKMYITMDRLDAIIQSKVRLERRFINEELFNVVLNELLIG
jgi:hypothetical protein